MACPGRSVRDHSKFCLEAWVDGGGYHLRSSFQILFTLFSTSVNEPSEHLVKPGFYWDNLRKRSKVTGVT